MCSPANVDEAGIQELLERCRVDWQGVRLPAFVLKDGVMCPLEIKVAGSQEPHAQAVFFVFVLLRDWLKFFIIYPHVEIVPDILFHFCHYYRAAVNQPLEFIFVYPYKSITFGRLILSHFIRDVHYFIGRPIYLFLFHLFLYYSLKNLGF